jgi:uncharacterized coiled-coil DUF342 family protein
MEEEQVKEQIIRVYELMNEISELKESVKERNQELNGLYESIGEYLKTSGNEVLKTDSGEFALSTSVKYNKKKR